MGGVSPKLDRILQNLAEDEEAEVRVNDGASHEGEGASLADEVANNFGGTHESAVGDEQATLQSNEGVESDTKNRGAVASTGEADRERDQTKIIEQAAPELSSVRPGAVPPRMTAESGPQAQKYTSDAETPEERKTDGNDKQRRRVAAEACDTRAVRRSALRDKQATTSAEEVRTDEDRGVPASEESHRENVTGASRYFDAHEDEAAHSSQNSPGDGEEAPRIASGDLERVECGADNDDHGERVAG
ncbi:unnamed protein product [Phytophthora fragariaefolia]|uniref:Unnamed protein product n=1 Tax=Phytophthora fragariaefolia TaxID=1490495 RepID=A0A9W6Y7T8_9STRA|nr:unnamed protein product [Phytophthora fragariaefolia]